MNSIMRLGYMKRLKILSVWDVLELSHPLIGMIYSLQMEQALTYILKQNVRKAIDIPIMMC